MDKLQEKKLLTLNQILEEVNADLLENPLWIPGDEYKDLQCNHCEIQSFSECHQQQGMFGIKIRITPLNMKELGHLVFDGHLANNTIYWVMVFEGIDDITALKVECQLGITYFHFLINGTTPQEPQEGDCSKLWQKKRAILQLFLVSGSDSESYYELKKFRTMGQAAVRATRYLYQTVVKEDEK